MKNLIEIFTLSFFVFFSGYFPGMLIVNFFPLKKEEKFVLSFALTFFLFYIIGFLSYIFNTNFTIFNGVFLLFSLILVVFYIFSKGFDIDAIKFLRNFFIIFLIFIIYQFFIPLYFGGLFYWDWFEHYLRSMFFLDRLPKNIVFEGYIIPSRPPFFNIVCFFYHSICGGEFYKYQIISTFLNSMLILSAWLFCKEYLEIENKNLFFIVSIIMFLNPAILRQITYTWTKAFCAFYVILGLYFYLHFLKNKDKLYLYIASFLLGISFIVHFSAGCYILPVFLHFLYTTILNKNLIKKFLISWLIFLFVVNTYFIWAVGNYGFYKTFLGTTAYQHQKNLSFIERFDKDMHNFLKTLNPFPLKIYREIFTNSSKFYKLFNYLYSTYICTLPGSLTFSLIFSLLFSIKNLNSFNFQSSRYFNLFLIFFFLLSYFLGTVSNPVKELSGVAHTGLLPITTLLFCFSIKNIFNMDKKKFSIFASFYLIETIFILFVFTTAYIIFFNPQKIIYLAKLREIDFILFSNFLLKYNNKLIFLYDKIISLR